MFKQLDIDYDKVTLDGVTLKKPSYLSISQWLEFWDNFDSAVIEAEIKTSFEEGYQCHKNEHEKEIDQIKDSILADLSSILKTIDKLTENNDLDSYEKLMKIKDEVEDSKDEIWRL